jgi:hypothetical protein
MSDRLIEQGFRQRLEQAVDDLKRDGWEVVGHERMVQLPRRLHKFRPDIIAIRGHEILVGEVKSRNSTELDELNELANVIAELPNARLEMYWLGDEPETKPEHARTREYIRAATELLENGHLDAATVMAWTALEVALYCFVVDTQAPIPSGPQARQTVWQLLSNLYSLGYISQRDFAQVNVLRKERNSLVHVGGRTTPDVKNIQYILRLADRMLTGRYVSVDQMVEWFLEHYERPEEHLPFESAEGGYQYMGNGPYYARDVLDDNFPEATEEDIAEAVETLEERSVEWVEILTGDA